MIKYSEDLKRVATRMLSEHGDYYDSSKKYLKSIMTGLSQEDLIEALHDLNIHELKEVMSAGVPGHACFVANQLLKKMKDEITTYIENKGAKATTTVEVDVPPEVEEDELEGVRTSKEGREGNSGEMDKSSTDSGT